MSTDGCFMTAGFQYTIETCDDAWEHPANAVHGYWQPSRDTSSQANLSPLDAGYRTTGSWPSPVPSSSTYSQAADKTNMSAEESKAERKARRRARQRESARASYRRKKEQLEALEVAAKEREEREAKARSMEMEERHKAAEQSLREIIRSQFEEISQLREANAKLVKSNRQLSEENSRLREDFDFQHFTRFSE
ncbi:uncharacterized protein I303_107982 [Kwoniella dejecticola CBS 10117]|uniref:BZIP domain-containing protein n=1 Tax=Kwoniella dejecticola CBS 10117 TaxID=1296121 RepID=A0AAJ8KV36_9TREE